MKRIIFSSVFITLTFLLGPLPTTAHAAPPLAVLSFDPGDTRSYLGSGTSLNSVGSESLTGTMTNVTYNSSFGGYLTFTGSSSYVSFTNPYEFGDYFTVTAWVRQTGSPSNINTLMANTTGGGNTNGFKLYWNTYTTNDRKLIAETGNGSSGSSAVTTNAVVSTTKWQQVAWVISRPAGTAYMYINGVQQPGSASVMTDFATNAAWRIGSFMDNAYSLQGNLGVMKIYKSALASSEVLSEYNLTSARYSVNLSLTTPYSLTTPATYRQSVTATVTTNTPGKFGLKANGKWIVACRSVAISSSATCTFKPSTHQAISLTVDFTPTDTTNFSAATASATPFGVRFRSNTR